VTGGRVWRTACVAGFALLVTLALSFARQGLRTRWLPARVAQARAATHAELERRGEDFAGVRALAVGLPGKEVRARLADAPPRRRRPLGGWGPIVVFLAAAFLVAAWGDASGRTSVPADLRLPTSARVNGDPLDDVFEYLSSYLTYDGSNLSIVLSRATPGERMTYVLEDVDEEIGNGGFEQLYWNSDGALVLDAIRYARMLGARSYAHALEVSTAVFPGGVVPAGEVERQRIIGPFESKRRSLTKADALWPERSYAPALRAYVRAHPSQFFR
jgi:hypothetical protein